MFNVLADNCVPFAGELSKEEEEQEVEDSRDENVPANKKMPC